MSFVDTNTEHFQSYRHNISHKARQYASGLMQAGSRKNIDRMAEVVPESKSRNLMPPAAFSLLIDIEPVMGMFDHPDAVPPLLQLGYQFFD